MNDLHKPLGTEAKPGKTGRLLPVVLSALTLCVVGYAGFVFYTASGNGKTIVALNEAKKTKSPVKQNTGDVTLQPETPSVEDDGKVKALSPLEPLDGEATPTAPAAPTLAFKPKPAKIARRSPGSPVADLLEQTEFGPLPRISTGGARPLDVYSLSSGTSGANRIAIVVGGLGLSQTGTRQAIAKLPSSVTLAFSPQGNSLQRWMQEARKDGHETVLQLPMEPLGYPTIDPGPRTLVSTLGPEENMKNLRWALGRMTNYPLVMNYLGAGFLNKRDKLQPILLELKARGLGYLDDGSVRASLSKELATDLALPNALGSITIDSDRNPQRMKANLAALESLARRRGFAIGVASAFPETVDFIKTWAEAAASRDVVIVPVSNLIKDFKR